MVKTFKVWTYKEGDRPLFHNGPMKNIYGIEGQFIEEMDDKMSTFTARHPDEAHAFFLPFSIANIVEYVYKPVTDYSRDRLQRITIDYIRVLANKYPFWNKSSGADHFFISCHDWVSHIFPSKI